MRTLATHTQSILGPLMLQLLTEQVAAEMIKGASPVPEVAAHFALGDVKTYGVLDAQVRELTPEEVAAMPGTGSRGYVASVDRDEGKLAICGTPEHPE